MTGHASYNQISIFCILCRDFDILCRDPHVGLSFVIKYYYDDVNRTLVVQINVAGYSLEA